MIQSLLAGVLLLAAAAAVSVGPVRKKAMVRGHLRDLEPRDGPEGEVIGVGDDAASLNVWLKQAMDNKKASPT
jgi:hypothetical protein